MPNHFHLMVEVKKVAIDGVPLAGSVSRGATLSRTPTGTPTGTPETLNQSIGIMLASYTRAINLQKKTTGSLFRQKTKAIFLNRIKGITSNWYTSFGATFLNVQIPEYQYPQVCFNYIHYNPVNAHLVSNPGEWEFSPYLDIAGIRNGKLVNKDRIQELGLKL